MIAAARAVPLTENSYLESDFVTNLLATVVDFQMHSTAVERAMTYYRSECFDSIRTLADLQGVLRSFPDDKEGNIALAQHLWGYKLWTRAEEPTFWVS